MTMINTTERITLTLTPEPWRWDAACLEVDPEYFFDPDLIHKGKQVCAGCPVADKCLATALKNGEEHGLWGGKTNRQLARMRRDAV